MLTVGRRTFAESTIRQVDNASHTKHLLLVGQAAGEGGRAVGLANFGFSTQTARFAFSNNNLNGIYNAWNS